MKNGYQLKIDDYEILLNYYTAENNEDKIEQLIGWDHSGLVHR
jgi:hypothetical protein